MFFKKFNYFYDFENATGPGFEPRLRASKAPVLPLDDPVNTNTVYHFFGICEGLNEIKEASKGLYIWVHSEMISFIPVRYSFNFL